MMLHRLWASILVGGNVGKSGRGVTLRAPGAGASAAPTRFVPRVCIPLWEFCEGREADDTCLRTVQNER